VADQIAAGEVVERPHSVVKELVENAIDAGATSIDIMVEDGGRGLIRVSDNGSGMSAEEALLSLERHATSKIRSASDLVGVRSFGFRGEALPAISSVSLLELETATSDGGGVRVTSVDGRPRIIGEIARRKGTTVSVSSLFRNVPARQKFLRGQRSEWRGIQEVVILLALSRLDLHLTVTHDGRRTHVLPAASSLRERISQLWGAQFAARMLDVDDVSGPTHVSGLVERPSDVGTASRQVHVLVNGRAVRDHGLLRAAETAYRNTIPAGTRPSLFLSVVVPGDSVDVNVHPAKSEIRFRERWPVERCVESAVRRALGTMDTGPAFGSRNFFPRAAPSPANQWTAVPHDETSRAALRDLFPQGAGAAVATSTMFPGIPADAHPENVADGTAPDVFAPDVTVPHLVQLRRTYMMFEREDGIVLIDQHSAHERVLFEDFMGSLDRGEAAGQRLLFPLTLHLTPAESDAFDANREMFERLGFEVDGFGGHTLLVRAVPMPHPRFDAERCLRESLAALTGDRVSSDASRHERLAATVACKAAIKAGDQLTQPEMRALFVALANTRLPAHDVHGRSAVVHLAWEEVERRFGRR
jgi:DNA mismatch repair protein MutL